MARPITAYIDHGCRPQWKKVYSIAGAAASGVPASARPGGMLPSAVAVR